MESFFTKNIKAIYSADPNSFHVYYHDENKRDSGLSCCFLITRSDQPITFWHYVWAGMLWMILEVGWETFDRILKIGDYTEAMEKEFMKDRLHYTLHRMVVDPASQGKGLGSRYLRQALIEKADRDGLPVYLTTQKEINVRFYKKL